MTQRAFILGSISFIIYVTVLFNGLPQFLILTWLLISLLVSSAGVALLSLQGLRCDWRVTRALTSESSESAETDEATETTSRDRDVKRDSAVPASGAPASDASASGASASGAAASGALVSGAWAGAPPSPGPAIEVRLANSGTLNKAGILLDVRLRHRGNGQRMTRRFLVEALPSGANIVATLTLSGLPRGRYQVEELRFVGSDVLGLFRASMRVAGHSSRPNRSAQPSRDMRRRLEDWSRTLAGPLRVAGGALLGAVGGGAAGGAVGYVAGRLIRDSHSSSSAGGAVGTMFGVLFGALVVGDHLRGQMRRRADKQARERDQRKDGEGTLRQVLVGPAALSVPSSPTSRTTVAGDDAMPSHLPGRGDEMRGTRPYVAGDDLRTVHWKSTARLGRLVVKEFHPPARLQCAVVWDGAAWDIALPPDAAQNLNAHGKNRRVGATAAAATGVGTSPNGALAHGASAHGALAHGALAHGAAQHQSATNDTAADDTAADGSETTMRDADEPLAEAFSAATEDGLRLTASLCRGLTAQGRPCTLLRLDRAAMCVAAGSGAPGAHGLPSMPAPDAATFGARCAETLADARADRDTPLSHALPPHLHRLGQGSRVYLVTTSLSPDAADAVRALVQRGLNVTVGLVVVPQPFDHRPPGRAAQLKAHFASRIVARWATATQDTSGATISYHFGGDKPTDRSMPRSYQQQAETLAQAGARVVLLPAGVRAESGAEAAYASYSSDDANDVKSSDVKSSDVKSSAAAWRDAKPSRDALRPSSSAHNAASSVDAAAPRRWENVQMALGRLLEAPGSPLPPGAPMRESAQPQRGFSREAFAARLP